MCGPPWPRKTDPLTLPGPAPHLFTSSSHTALLPGSQPSSCPSDLTRGPLASSSRPPLCTSSLHGEPVLCKPLQVVAFILKLHLTFLRPGSRDLGRPCSTSETGIHSLRRKCAHLRFMPSCVPFTPSLCSACLPITPRGRGCQMLPMSESLSRNGILQYSSRGCGFSKPSPHLPYPD